MASKNETFFDSVVIGGGPAGATAGRFLAQWGYSVLILTRPSTRPTLAECLPPSTRKLFKFFGILEQVDRAGFYRTSGNTFWWGGGPREAQNYPGPRHTWGYQVLRSEFDRLLLTLAEGTGAKVCPAATVRDVDLGKNKAARLHYETADGEKNCVTSRFVLDCSGRAGVIARQGFRAHETRHNTLALCGVWEKEGGWGLEDETHTLVESYKDGWAWSIPISPTVRYFTAMVDVRDSQIARGNALDRIYGAELAKTAQFRKILQTAAPRGEPWGCDASLYSAHRFAGSHFLLVGDAASSIDPLSSFGVKKALASAWAAAVVVNTCLKRPSMREAALEFFSNRERQVYETHRKQSARYFSEAAHRHPHPFWTRRGQAPVLDDRWEMDEEELKQDPEVLSALKALKQSSSIHLQMQDRARIAKSPVIEGNEVVLREAIATATNPLLGLPYLWGVNLPKLTSIAGGYRQVPELFDAYNRICPPVALPHLLGALAFLLAKRVLRNAAGSDD